MWRNYEHWRYYYPGTVEQVSGGIGKWTGVLFMFSPYLFLPYLLYRAIDESPSLSFGQPHHYNRAFPRLLPGQIYHTTALKQSRSTIGFPAHGSLILIPLCLLILGYGPSRRVRPAHAPVPGRDPHLSNLRVSSIRCSPSSATSTTSSDSRGKNNNLHTNRPIYRQRFLSPQTDRLLKN